MPEPVAPATAGADDAEARAARRLMIQILVGGALIPWVSGACVKLYLDAQYAPTWPWSAFLDPGSLFIELFYTALFAIPYVVLAGIARHAFRGGRLPFLDAAGVGRRRAVVSCSLVGGWIMSALFFVSLFRQFDWVSLLVAPPFAVVAVALAMTAGWSAGLAGVRLEAVVTRRRHG